MIIRIRIRYDCQVGVNILEIGFPVSETQRKSEEIQKSKKHTYEYTLSFEKWNHARLGETEMTQTHQPRQSDIFHAIVSVARHACISNVFTFC